MDGGSERSLVELAMAMEPCGWQVRLAVWSPGDLEAAFRTAGFETYVLGRPDPASPLSGATRRIPRIESAVRVANWLRLALRPVNHEVSWLCSAIQRYEPHLIHSNCDLSLPAVALAARRTGLPFVAHVRDHWRSWFHRRHLHCLQRAAAVIVASASMAERLLKFGIKAEVVPNPVGDPQLSRPISPDERQAIRRSLGIEHVFAVGMVGRIDAQKGALDLVSVARHLRDVPRPCKFLIAGQGSRSDERAFLHAAAEMGVAESFQLLGYRDDVGTWLPTLDALVVPARAEPFGRVIVEGMLAGLPVIAYADGAGPELIRNGQTGLLVAPGDTAAFAGALRMLISRPSVGLELGRAARIDALERWSPATVGRMMNTVYELSTGTAHACTV